MSLFSRRIAAVFTALALAFTVVPAMAETGDPVLNDLTVPGLNEFAAPPQSQPLAVGEAGEVTLSALLTGEEEAQDIPRGLVWRIFAPEPDADGKLPLVATAEGGTSTFTLPPGGYLVHAAYGRAGATKRITVGREPKSETLVLDAGGLKLDAVLSGDLPIPSSRLSFSVYELDADATGERPLVVPNVQPNAVVRLNAGTYHVVSTFGAVNAVIRADIRVEAGKLTEATMEHRAAQLTLKLVREPGGEAIADTSWSVLSETGEIVKETVGAFASMVLAEGEYTVVANNRDRIYQRDFTVIPGRNQDVELLPDDLVETNDDEAPG